MSKTNPFEFVDSVSSTKINLMEAGASERDYSPYLTNRSLSYHSDAVLYANEMNFWSGLDNRLQYEYLLRSLRRRSRRGKWVKPEDAEAVELVSWRYGLSREKARAALELLTSDHVLDIKRQREQDT